MKIIRWSELLWAAMARSQKGFRKPSMRWSGRGVYRRTDKLEAAARRQPVYTGKLNFRRSDPRHPRYAA